VVQKEYTGVRLALLIGNVNAKLWYDCPHTADAEGVQRESSHELEIVKRMGLLRPGSVVFDVGAHQGCYSLCLASWVGPRGHVYAFEPFPQNADLIRYNARLNGAQNITVVQAAAGATKGRIRVSQDHQSVAPADAPSFEVDCVALDDFAAARPDLLKIDVEGFEASALRGAQKILASVPNLVIEVHHCYLPRLGSRVEDVLGCVDWDKYDCWFIDSSDSSVRPWRPETPLVDRQTSWLFARRRAEAARVAG
jgi:FkbM family methyltransferase